MYQETSLDRSCKFFEIFVFQISLDENVRDRILDGLADVADMMEDSLKN
jgi:hypothetical protein